MKIFAPGCAIGTAVPSGTPKSVLYIDASGHLAQDNASFNYDPITHTLTLGGPVSSKGLTVTQASAGVIAQQIVLAALPTGDAIDVFKSDGTTKLWSVAADGTMVLGNYTPFAWDPGVHGIQTNMAALGLGVVGDINLNSNGYFTSGAWKYMATGVAANHLIYNGQHLFRVAPTGTAGNPLTWQTPVQIDIAGIKWLMGNSTTLATAMAVASVQTSAAGVGNGADTTDDTLFTYTLPAAALTPVSKSIRVRAWGTTAANANNKQIKIWFGGVAIVTSGVVTISGKNWCIEAEITSQDLTHASVVGTYADGTSGLVAGDIAALPNQVVPDMNANTTIIKVTGASSTTGAANDVLGYGMKVWHES